MTDLSRAFLDGTECLRNSTGYTEAEVDEIKHGILQLGGYETCCRCRRSLPSDQLYVPDGSTAIDTSPPIYQWFCIDRVACVAARGGASA